MKNYNDTKMCKLIKKGVPASDPEGFADLIRGAEFFCKKCGASARDKKCLCKPRKI
ncbi:MAG: hypothetical protein PQJ60_08960 [Spirochaetales bacterium]|nr:hypothetical protein [Spirochaetales bacterium]